MWAAIGAIIGLGTSANAGAQAQYMQERAEYGQSLGFSQAKDLAFYNAYGTSTKSITTIAIIGFIFLLVIVYLLTR